MKTSWSTLRSMFISGSSRRPDQSFFFISHVSWPWNDSFLSSKEFSIGMNSFSLRTNGKYLDPPSAPKVSIHQSGSRSFRYKVVSIQAVSIQIEVNSLHIHTLHSIDGGQNQELHQSSTLVPAVQEIY